MRDFEDFTESIVVAQNQLEELFSDKIFSSSALKDPSLQPFLQKREEIRLALLKLDAVDEMDFIFHNEACERVFRNVMTVLDRYSLRLCKQLNEFSARFLAREYNKLTKQVFDIDTQAKVYHALNSLQSAIRDKADIFFMLTYHMEQQTTWIRHLETFSQSRQLNFDLPLDDDLKADYESNFNGLKSIFRSTSVETDLFLVGSDGEEENKLLELEQGLKQLAPLFDNESGDEDDPRDLIHQAISLTDAAILLKSFETVLTKIKEKRVKEANLALLHLDILLEPKYHLAIDLTRAQSIQRSLKKGLNLLRKPEHYRELLLLTNEAKQQGRTLRIQIPKAKKERERQKKLDFERERGELFDYYNVFKRYRFPTFIKRMKSHKALGILPEHLEKQGLRLFYDAKVFLNTRFSTTMEKDEYRAFRKRYKHLEFRMNKLRASLYEEHNAFIQKHQFFEHKAFYVRILEGTDTYAHCMKNKPKLILLDVWLNQIEEHLQDISCQEWYLELNVSFWRLKLKCGEEYTNDAFVRDVMHLIADQFSEKKLQRVSREDNGRILSFLRIHILSPVYNFLYFIGVFGERSPGFFSNRAEAELRELIYDTRRDLHSLEQERDLTQAPFIEQVRRTTIHA